mmetsp:Transcript_5832/g.7588  ORF Transcript_5832/g.7588 Transcript_5832/m.7588 type:complete len:265 (+) Transcript_5832:163-957(+)
MEIQNDNMATQEHVVKIKDESDNSEYESESSEAKEELAQDKGVGMADVISKLLGQNVGKANPVLAKRKTKMMKEREAQAAEKKDLTRRQLENKEKKERAFVKADVTTLPYERQLKKVANRGVVALFNAIAKHQRGVTEEDTAQPGKDVGGTAKTASKAGFLNMLKGASDTSTPKQEEADRESTTASTWAALDDNYMMETKGWDQEPDSEESGEEREEEEIEFGDSDDDNNDEYRKAGGKRARSKKASKAKKKIKKKKKKKNTKQ